MDPPGGNRRRWGSGSLGFGVEVLVLLPCPPSWQQGHLAAAWHPHQPWVLRQLWRGRWSAGKSCSEPQMTVIVAVVVHGMRTGTRATLLP